VNRHALTAPLLIVGASGQLGCDLVRACKQHQIRYLRAQRVPQPGCITLDLAKETDYSALLTCVQPACVVNAAAYTAVDAAETDKVLVRQVNTVAPGALAKACQQLSIPLIHFSTDYVFSGVQDQAYKEGDGCDPVNIYGQSKLEGEQRIRDCNDCHYIFRSSWLYRPGHHNFVTTMLRLFAGENSINVVDDQWGCPTWTRPLAEAVISFLQHGLADPYCLQPLGGTYHLCAQGQTSWYNFARAIAERAVNKPIGNIQAINSSLYKTPAARPKYSVLDCARAQQKLQLRLPSWAEQLDNAMPFFNDLQRSKA